MPRNLIPSYCKHKASGQAVVKLNGKDFYLGKYNTKASKVEYERLIGEWIANGRSIPHEELKAFIDELCVDYVLHAKSYYRKNGKQTTEYETVKAVLREFREVYGGSDATDFGPIKFKAFRERFIERGLCRTTINAYMSHIIRTFKNAAGDEKISPAIYQSLQSVERLKSGRSEAKETKKIPPASSESIEAIKPFLLPIVADMVELQRLTGMRPSEVCNVRPVDIQRGGEVWLYTPESHKTEHHGKSRVIPIGDQGQAVLSRYLLREEAQYCFSPTDAVRQWQESKKRKTPLSCGNRKGHRSKVKSASCKAGKPRKAGERYTSRSYRRAIHRACTKAEIPKFSPNQIRKRAATDVRKIASLEAAQILLGHASKSTTERFYAEMNIDEAIQVMAKIG